MASRNASQASQGAPRSRHLRMRRHASAESAWSDDIRAVVPAHAGIQWLMVNDAESPRSRRRQYQCLSHRSLTPPLLFLGNPIAPNLVADLAAHRRGQAVHDRGSLSQLGRILPGSDERGDIKRTRELHVLAKILIVLAARVEPAMEFQHRLDDPLRLGITLQPRGD